MKNTRIIHICNDYSKQALYKALFSSLSRKNVNQEVYVPVRSEKEIGKYHDPNFNVIQSHILKPIDRIMFRSKITKIQNDFLKNIKNFSSNDIIHAHFLYSDGAVALNLKRIFNSKYIVAVRNTDLNYFLKFRPDLYFLMISILKEAEKVIFLNHGYMNRLINILSDKNRMLLSSKSLVIPNGIDDDWLDNNFETKKKFSNNLRLLYVGDFTKNKNVPMLVQAYTKLQNMGIDASLTIAGGGGDAHNEVIKILDNKSDSIKYLGRINRDELKNLYGCSDILIVPSRHETFGMVFIEALSQGCKVIFKEGEAITGLIDDTSIAHGLKKISVTEIVQSIIRLSKNEKSSRAKCINAAKEFSLSKLSKKYIELYEEIF